MFQHTAGGSTIGVELTAIFLCGDGKPDGVLRHCNRAVSHQTIKPQTRNVKDILWLENDRAAFHGMGIIGTELVLIVELTVFIPVNHHSVRHQRIQTDDLILAVADDLGIGIPPEEQVRHERFPERKGCHFWVRLIMQ